MLTQCQCVLLNSTKIAPVTERYKEWYVGNVSARGFYWSERYASMSASVELSYCLVAVVFCSSP